MWDENEQRINIIKDAFFCVIDYSVLIVKLTKSTDNIQCFCVLGTHCLKNNNSESRETHCCVIRGFSIGVKAMRYVHIV